MINSLRTALVVLAGLSTTIAGVTGSLASAAFPPPSIHGLSGRLVDGTREDDSGRPVEEAEEDDTEKQGGREVHLLSAIAAADPAAERGQFTAADASCEKPRLQRLASPIRGPPAIA